MGVCVEREKETKWGGGGGGRGREREQILHCNFYHFLLVAATVLVLTPVSADVAIKS